MIYVFISDLKRTKPTIVPPPSLAFSESAIILIRQPVTTSSGERRAQTADDDDRAKDLTLRKCCLPAKLTNSSKSIGQQLRSTPDFSFSSQKGTTSRTSSPDLLSVYGCYQPVDGHEAVADGNSKARSLLGAMNW